MREKKNFYFQHSNGTYTCLLKNCTEREAMVKMKKFLDEHNFKSYYTRTWDDDDGNRHYDVGSHSEFFVFGFI